jgi:hypothetical protein
MIMETHHAHKAIIVWLNLKTDHISLKGVEHGLKGNINLELYPPCPIQINTLFPAQKRLFHTIMQRTRLHQFKSFYMKKNAWKSVQKILTWYWEYEEKI